MSTDRLDRLGILETFSALTTWNFVAIPLWGFTSYMGSKTAVAYVLVLHFRDFKVEAIAHWTYQSSEQIYKMMKDQDKSLNNACMILGIFVAFLFFQPGHPQSTPTAIS